MELDLDCQCIKAYQTITGVYDVIFESYNEPILFSLDNHSFSLWPILYWCFWVTEQITCKNITVNLLLLYYCRFRSITGCRNAMNRLTSPEQEMVDWRFQPLCLVFFMSNAQFFCSFALIKGWSDFINALNLHAVIFADAPLMCPNNKHTGLLSACNREPIIFWDFTPTSPEAVQFVLFNVYVLTCFLQTPVFPLPPNATPSQKKEEMKCLFSSFYKSCVQGVEKKGGKRNFS